MNEAQIRAEFEAWYRDKFCKTLSGMATDEMMYIGSNGEYSSFHVRGAWEGWQAALSAKSVPDEVEALRHQLKIEQRFRELSLVGAAPGHDYWERYFQAKFEVELAKLAAAPQPTDDRVRELEAKYNELIMAVARKFPNETRHDTAVRYIRNAEEPTDDRVRNLLMRVAEKVRELEHYPRKYGPLCSHTLTQIVDEVLNEAKKEDNK